MMMNGKKKLKLSNKWPGERYSEDGVEKPEIGQLNKTGEQEKQTSQISLKNNMSIDSIVEKLSKTHGHRPLVSKEGRGKRMIGQGMTGKEFTREGKMRLIMKSHNYMTKESATGIGAILGMNSPIKAMKSSGKISCRRD